MRIPLNVVIVVAILALIVMPGPALAQSPGGAEARLKELNIVLPPDAVPAANFVNAVQTGKLLFLAGNTSGADWPLKGKVGKDLNHRAGLPVGAAGRDHHARKNTQRRRQPRSRQAHRQGARHGQFGRWFRRPGPRW